MKRGEVWTVAGGLDYAGKPRPAVIVQDDSFGDLDSITLCLLSTNASEALFYRPRIAPSETNGLHRPSALLVDKLSTVPKTKLGSRVGKLADEDMLQLNRAVLVFLGLGNSPHSTRASRSV